MSTYTRVSKSLGLEGKARVPSFEKAQELIKEARAGNEAAFAKIFKIIRFAPSPHEEDKVKALNLLFDAFHGELSDKYRGEDV